MKEIKALGFAACYHRDARICLRHGLRTESEAYISVISFISAGHNQYILVSFVSLVNSCLANRSISFPFTKKVAGPHGRATFSINLYTKNFSSRTYYPPGPRPHCASSNDVTFIKIWDVEPRLCAPEGFSHLTSGETLVDAFFDVNHHHQSWDPEQFHHQGWCR